MSRPGMSRTLAVSAGPRTLDVGPAAFAITFADGTVTPALLTCDNWDRLAEAANWARRNADVLVDMHWIGGDSRRLVVTLEADPA